MRVDMATRTIVATPADVYAAFVDADCLVRWLPPAGMSGAMDWFDVSVGGGFRMVLTYQDPSEGAGKVGDGTDVAEVRIVDLQPPHRVVWEIDFPSDDPDFAGTMRMAWTVRLAREAEDSPDGAGPSEVTVEATDVPPGISAEDHAVGLSSSLANLAAEVERQP